VVAGMIAKLKKEWMVEQIKFVSIYYCDPSLLERAFVMTPLAVLVTLTALFVSSAFVIV
jgi:hypothetical protein